MSTSSDKDQLSLVASLLIIRGLCVVLKSIQIKFEKLLKILTFLLFFPYFLVLCLKKYTFFFKKGQNLFLIPNLNMSLDCAGAF